MFIGAIHVKIQDGQVTNRPIYVAIGVTTSGERTFWGCGLGDGGEGAKFWLSVLTEIKSRGTAEVYTAPKEAAARERFAEFSAKWGGQYPAIIKLWKNAWTEFIPFLDYDVEIRQIICSTNATESINAR